MIQRLSQANIATLPNTIEQPKYQVEQHKAGIVHIGIGAFHRGHQAVFTDDAMSISGGDWRIVGVSLRSNAVAQQLNPQNGYYTVTSKNPSSESCRLIGAVQEVLVAPENPQAVIDQLACPSIKVVTLTVTEKGYHYDMGNACLRADSADIVKDIAQANSPCSMPGFLVAGFKQRMQRTSGDAGKINVISCDNLPNNGEITKKVVMALAAASNNNQDLVEWIEKHVSFCSSMVDRIVPAVNAQHQAQFTQTYGFEDQGMINTEAFKQWVIEDKFITSVPDWKAAGVFIVKDVSAYEMLKLRTLNGSHSALAYMGVLLGHAYIHEAMQEALLHNMAQALMRNETGPSITVPDGFNLDEYQQQTLQRFENANIPYATQQVAMDGSQKLVQRVFMPMLENFTRNVNNADKIKQSRILLSIVAAWIIYLSGKNEGGDTHDINDPMAQTLKALLNQHQSDKANVSALCNINAIVPKALADDELFTTSLTSYLEDIRKHGLQSHLHRILD